jgi:hypothetical protein
VVFALLLASASEDVVRAGGNIPKPARTAYEDPLRPPPGYTPIGIVILDITVGESGEPIDVTFVRGGQFKNAIDLDAIKRWRYQPTVIDGRPAKVAFRELLELFPSPDVRAGFYGHAIQDRKESKGYRLFALDQLRMSGSRTPEVVKALRRVASDADPDVSAAAKRLLEAGE